MIPIASIQQPNVPNSRKTAQNLALVGGASLIASAVVFSVREPSEATSRLGGMLLLLGVAAAALSYKAHTLALPVENEERLLEGLVKARRISKSNESALAFQA